MLNQSIKVSLTVSLPREAVQLQQRRMSKKRAICFGTAHLHFLCCNLQELPLSLRGEDRAINEQKMTGAAFHGSDVPEQTPKGWRRSFYEMGLRLLYFKLLFWSFRGQQDLEIFYLDYIRGVLVAGWVMWLNLSKHALLWPSEIGNLVLNASEGRVTDAAADSLSVRRIQNARCVGTGQEDGKSFRIPKEIPRLWLAMRMKMVDLSKCCSLEIFGDG
ncbi:hypothetical protein ACLOJK_032037 [Asimina triloba]